MTTPVRGTVRLRRLANGAGLPLPAYQSEKAAGLDLAAAIPDDETLTIAPGARQLPSDRADGGNVQSYRRRSWRVMAAALAISRDVTISEGDALSPSTRQLISDAGGGEVAFGSA